jgi:hypothetical protein
MQHPTVVQSAACLLYYCSFLTELQQLSYSITVDFLVNYSNFLIVLL